MKISNGLLERSDLQHIFIKMWELIEVI